MMMDAAMIEVIEKAKAGDDQAFDTLYKAYVKNAYAYAYQLTQSQADAQDIVQDAFIQIHKSIRNLQEPKHFYVWMRKIIRSKAIDFFYRNRHSISFEPSKMEETKSYQESRRYMLPEDASQYSSEQNVLLNIINKMDDKYAEVIYLTYFEQMKMHEIASYLNIPEGTVKTRCARAKKELKERIRAFEKTEHRKLHFNADAILPGISCFSLSWMIGQSKHGMQAFLQTNVATAACVVSVTTLSITGTVMVANDVQQSSIKQSDIETIASKEQPAAADQQKEQTETIILPSKAFQPHVYKERMITSTKEAYYMCMNWADSLEQMQEKQPSQMDEIMPIYHEIRQANDQYYHMLQESGWEAWFLSL